ncbi:MAG: ankyrin repeat domain-containing protein [Azonexaceae bacterium]|nr:ankyrin repeat domain-containing protein [Azonexaceae bacterium]
MSSQLLLIQAIRSGKLAEVRAALDAGAPIEQADDQGDPGLPMGMACFLGYVDIVRELVQRGAKINLADNRASISPLSMAIRGKRVEVVRTLLELGAELPAGMATGLTDNEVLIAQWKARRDGCSAAPVLDPADLDHIEEIDMTKCVGTDTTVLEADALRIASQMR